MPEPLERTALYRLYDAEHDLLYAGISRTPSERFKAHAHERNWWHLVTFVDLTWYENYASARKAEIATHMSERPPFNGMANIGEWSFAAMRYDDSAEQAAVRSTLLSELAAGQHAVNDHLWPFHISRRLGYSRSTVTSAMTNLVREGYLRFSGRTFIVAQQGPFAEGEAAPA